MFLKNQIFLIIKNTVAVAKFQKWRIRSLSFYLLSWSWIKFSWEFPRILSRLLYLPLWCRRLNMILSYFSLLVTNMMHRYFLRGTTNIIFFIQSGYLHHHLRFGRFLSVGFAQWKILLHDFIASVFFFFFLARERILSIIVIIMVVSGSNNLKKKRFFLNLDSLFSADMTSLLDTEYWLCIVRHSTFVKIFVKSYLFHQLQSATWKPEKCCLWV